MNSDSADTPPPIDTYGSDSRSDSNTGFNALIGGAAGIVCSFVPGSTLLGGAVAGYLEGGDTTDGLRVGALAGVVAFVPFVLIGLFGWLFFFGVGAPATMGALLVAFLAFMGLYTVGLSLLGGVVGIYVKDEL